MGGPITITPDVTITPDSKSDLSAQNAKIGAEPMLIEPVPWGPFESGLTQQAARNITSVLPWAGGGLGAALGSGLASIPGAMIGGGGGEALRQLTNRFLGLKEPETETSMGAASKIGSAGALQGGLEAATAGLGAIAKPVAGPLVKSAEEQLGKVLAPTTTANKALAQRILPRLAQESPVAMTREGLLQRVGSSLSVARDALDEALSKVPSTKALPQSSKNAVIDRLQALGDSMMTKAPGGQTIPVPGSEASLAFIRGMQQTIKLVDPSFENMRNLRQVLDKMVDANGKWNLTGVETSQREIQRFTANALRQELSRVAPDVAAANKDYSFYKSVQSVLEDTVQRTTGQQGNLTRRILMAGGAAAGSHAGIGGMVTGAAVMKGLAQLADSTAWRTVSAANKMRLASLIANDELPRAAALISRLGGAASSASPAGPESK